MSFRHRFRFRRKSLHWLKLVCLLLVFVAVVTIINIINCKNDLRTLLGDGGLVHPDIWSQDQTSTSSWSQRGTKLLICRNAAMCQQRPVRKKLLAHKHGQENCGFKDKLRLCWEVNITFPVYRNSLATLYYRLFIQLISFLQQRLMYHFKVMSISVV